MHQIMPVLIHHALMEPLANRMETLILVPVLNSITVLTVRHVRNLQ